jgi:hypothetical protein
MSEGKGVRGAEISQMLKRPTDEHATMAQLATWAPVRTDERSCEEAGTRWRESEDLRLQESIGEVMGQTEGATSNLSKTEEAVEP